MIGTRSQEICTYLGDAQSSWHRIEVYRSVVLSRLLGSTTRSPQDSYLNMTFDKDEAKTRKGIAALLGR
jgi:hypothetical protein